MADRIAFITESSHRQKKPMPAYLFYQGPHSRWVNSIIQYMEERKFTTENIFFLSFFQQRIIPYHKTIENYPIQKHNPTKEARKEFAKKILKFILSYEETPFVEFHTGKKFYEEVLPLLDEHGIPFRVYAEGIALGKKDAYYLELIEEEQQKRRMKRIQREKRFITGLIEHKDPYFEAKRIIDDYEKKASLFGVEPEFEELKYLIRKYYQRKKDEIKSKKEVEGILNQIELQSFLKSKKNISSLMKNLGEYEKFKSQYGKELAKYTRFLIKQEYVKQTETKIANVLLKLQIALLRTS